VNPNCDIDALLGRLRALYADVDASLAHSSCPATTECCRFGITGREPYVTGIEIVAIRQAVRARGGPLSLRRRALPMLATAERERICPLLDSSGKCSVYADRPLGCRTYFCSRATHAPDHASIRVFVRRLADLAAEHEARGELGRPLTRVLAEKDLR